MHKTPPDLETVELPKKKPRKQEPLDIALQGFYYTSITLMIIIGAACLLLEAAHWITTP